MKFCIVSSFPRIISIFALKHLKISGSLGFYHMQNAHNRLDYVTIQWENICPETEEYYFNKFDSSVLTNFNTSYDYLSIIHQNSFAFSKNGKRTIITKVSRNSMKNPRGVYSKVFIEIKFQIFFI